MRELAGVHAAGGAGGGGGTTIWRDWGSSANMKGKHPWGRRTTRSCGDWARLVGSVLGEVVMMNAMVNLHLMMVSIARRGSGSGS